MDSALLLNVLQDLSSKISIVFLQTAKHIENLTEAVQSAFQVLFKKEDHVLLKIVENMIQTTDVLNVLLDSLWTW